jgi:hypothetical protein
VKKWEFGTVDANIPVASYPLSSLTAIMALFADLRLVLPSLQLHLVPAGPQTLERQNFFVHEGRVVQEGAKAMICAPQTAPCSVWHNELPYSAK